MDDLFGATINLLEPLCLNDKWCVPFIPMVDCYSVRLSPSVGNIKATIFLTIISSYSHYPKWMIFWSPFEFVGATLFKCQMVSAFHTNDGFLFRWSFSLCWIQKSNYFSPLCHHTLQKKVDFFGTTCRAAQ